MVKLPTVFLPKSRLHDIINAPDATLVDELAAAAQKRIETRTNLVLEFVRKLLTEMSAISALDDVALSGRRAELRTSAVQVAEVAAAAGLTAVGDVCRGLMSMLESWDATDTWNVAAVRVHLSALALVSDTSKPAAEHRVVLDELKVLREAIGAT